MLSKEAEHVKKMYREMIDFNQPLEHVRHMLEQFGDNIPLPERIEHLKMNTHNVCGEWLKPLGADQKKVMVYFHGGGYALGVYNSNRRFVAQLSEACNMNGFLIDYRLAPEHPYPAAIEDGMNAYKYLLESGYSPENIYIAGDSSGCGLALVVVKQLIEEKKQLPNRMVFMSPVVDLTHSNTTFETRKEVDPLQLKREFFTDKHYTHNQNKKDHKLSPIFGDLSGLPPMLIHASDHDVFLGDAEDLKQRSEAAEVEVTYKNGMNFGTTST